MRDFDGTMIYNVVVSITERLGSDANFVPQLSSTPRKTQPVGHQSFPASKSFHQMSQEAEPKEETDEDVDMDLQNMLDAPSPLRRHLFNPPDYNTPPASQTQLRSAYPGQRRVRVADD